MELVELYKVRWPFVRFALILVLFAGLTAALASHATVEVNGSHVVFATGLSAFATFPMIFAVVFSAWLGTSLSRERTTLALSWTTPLPRWSSASRIIAVDLTAVVTSYAFAWILVVLVLLALGQPLVDDPQLWPTIALSLGVVVMWYALVSAATSGWEQNRFVISALLGGSFVSLVASSLPLAEPLRTFVRAINVLNPFAYLSAMRATGTTVTATSLWALDVPQRALIVWVLSIVLLAVATVVWSRKEA